MNESALEEVLAKNGIRVYHSSRFLAGAKGPEQYLRVSLSSANSLERLATGLKILSSQLKRMEQ